MARTKRDLTIENRTNRLKLAPSPEPEWTKLDKGRFLGYRRLKSGSGTWIARIIDLNATPTKRYQSLGTADDYAEADGRGILNYSQAQEAARAWFKVAEREAHLAACGEALREGPYTVKHAMADYIDDQRRRGKRGAGQAELASKAHIVPSLGDIELSKLTPGRLRRWLTALAESPRRRRGKFGSTEPVFLPAPKTPDEIRARRDSANRIWTSLKAALNLALAHGNVADDKGWKGVKGFEGTTKARIRHLSLEDQRRLVNACPPELRRLVTGALHTGARYGELTSLEVGDFDAKAGTVHVAAHVAKTGKPRNIVLTAEGIAFFSSVTAGRKSGERIFQRDAVARRKHEALGQAWGKNDHVHMMAAAFTAAGIDRVTFHELRHSYASMLINAGMSLGDVAEQLGDSEVTTRKHYVHLCPDALAARVRAVAPVLGINPTEDVTPLAIKLKA